jgi:hypothetical protein
VQGVHNGIATLQRCTRAGRVLNPRYRWTVAVEHLLAQYELHAGGVG